MKTIYYGKCEHLYADDITDRRCLKRYFICNHPNQYDVIRIAICNDYLKLKTNELLFENNKDKYYYSIRGSAYYSLCICEEIISEVLKKEFNYDIGRYYGYIGYNERNLLKYFIAIPAIKDDYLDYNHTINLYYNLNLKSAIEIYFEKGYFKEEIINVITEYLKRIDKYKKYQNIHNENFKLLRQLDNYGLKDEEKTLIINNLFINILKNYNYETTKQ